MKRILFIQPATCDTWTRFIDGIYDFARDQDWMFLALNNSSSATRLKQQIRHWQPDGCIVDCMNGHGFHPEIFRTLDCSVVYLNHPEDKSLASQFAVCEDSARITNLALEHLRNLGSTHLVFIRHPDNPEWARRRLEAFKSFGCKANLPFSILTASQAADPKRIARLPPHTGILGCCDMTAQISLQTAILIGRRIPEDVAIIGIDNEPIVCEAQTPGLSSVSIERFRAGRLLGELMALRISTPTAFPRTLRYGPEGIQIRGSTRLLRMPSSKIQAALEFIRMNACNGHLSIDAVAKVMGCARTRAAVLFRQTTGKSILEEINETRFQHACKLLRDTSLPISTIVASCGYDSSTFFKRTFKARTGLTMRAWRARALARVSSPTGPRVASGRQRPPSRAGCPQQPHGLV